MLKHCFRFSFPGGSDDSDDDKTPMILGVVFGVLGVFVFGGAIYWFMCRNKMPKSEPQYLADSTTEMTPGSVP